MEHLIDLGAYPVRDVLPILLKDRTTDRNIIWAADTYEEYGDECKATHSMRVDLLLNGPTIQPRIAKNVDAQLSRTKKFAEVFTPSWLCNLMNNYCDEVWFGRKDVFNHTDGHEWTPTEGAVAFPKRKRWQRYVDSRRLEITCGEAPYLTSRYDAVTGEFIPFARRIGVLDRKLRVVNENAADEAEWWKYTCRAFESTYGYEYQGDNLLIARINLLSTFSDSVWEKWNRHATDEEIFRIAEILTWNIWQMDGLKGTVPQDSLRAKSRQLHFFEQLGLKPSEAKQETQKCRIMNWRGQHQLTYVDRKRKIGKNREGAEMKFDFVIGNPPYQDESNGEKRNFAPPVYHLFIDEAYKAGEKVEMIHPARFLFNAGSTPKAWNEKMLNDPHLKVLHYEPDSDKVFTGLTTPIKGGIAITYHDKKTHFGAIQAYTQFPELNAIAAKVKKHPNFKSLSDIVYSRTSYRLTNVLHLEHPNAISKVSKGHAFDVSSNIYSLLPEVFYDTKPNDGKEYIQLLGRDGSKRIYKFIRRDYVNKVANLDTYKVFVAQASGSGLFGETLSQPIVEKPAVGATETFLSIGSFESEQEAINVEKYIKTKFLRALLGILKVTQNGNKPVWKMIPLQNFTPSSDIDWSVSVAEIDRQLYRKYNLSEEEIAFIETKVKEMA